MERMSRRDIEAGWVGSFLGLADQTGYVTPCLVDGSWDEDGEAGMWFMPVNKQGESQRRKRVRLGNERIVWEHPDTGFYVKDDKTEMSFVRRSGRQYIRGVRPDYMKVDGRRVDVSQLGACLHSIYNPNPYLTWPQAVEALEQVGSTALSIFLSVHKAEGGLVVKMRDTPVGEVVDGTLNGSDAFRWMMEEVGYDSYA